MIGAMRTIDALGTWCPVPVSLLRRAAMRAAQGDIIVVLADDPLVKVDIPAWCHDQGHEVIAVEDDAGVITTRVRISPRT